MLLELKIKNFVIIDELTVSFSKGLNILTGETGAGKSILIDALSAVMGERMTTDMIRSGFEKSIIEGTFDIVDIPQIKEIMQDSGIEEDGDSLILRRELYSNGRGRSFANATQIPVSKLRDISEYLVDIHGQNEHQNIVKIAKHRELLDSFAGHTEEVKKIRELHQRLTDIRESLASFEIDEREKARRIEYNKFAITEIENARLKPGEDEELKNESMLLSNAEKIFKEINIASSMMNGDSGIIQLLKRTEQSLSAVTRYDESAYNLLESVKEALYSLEDAGIYLRDYEKNIDFSPQRINEVEERLSLIASFKKKYGDTIAEINEYGEKARRELDAITSSDEEMDRLRNEQRRVNKEAKESALALSEKRKKAAMDLEKLVMKELNDLGMSGTVFRVSIKREISPDGEIETDNKRYVLYPHGLDRVEFMLSANKGEDLRQLKKVASGGEMSRIMLALKNVILSADIVESLIFDEVDAGISGKIAEIVGKKLRALSRDRQVLVITHLPQIAAMSDCHFSVQKEVKGDRISTIIRGLNEKEKIREVARLLAGETITDLSIKHAEEMVRQNL